MDDLEYIEAKRRLEILLRKEENGYFVSICEKAEIAELIYLIKRYERTL